MLNREELKKLVEEKELVKNYIDLDTQLTPNGFDFTAEKIFEFSEKGCVDFSNSERELPECRELKPKKRNPEDEYGWYELSKGSYKVRTNETVNIPKDMIAISFSRSTLLRMGAFTQHAVWEAGFSGKSEFLLVVQNPHGISLKENARVNQIIFIPINETKEGYSGIYKNID